MAPTHRGGLVFGCLVWFMLVALTAPAQNAAAPAAGEPALVLSASVASLDKVAEFGKELGLGELPFLSADFIEQRMPFIGAGGLAPDRPMGVLYYLGPDIDLEQSATFVLPVNPGKAELKTFVANGAQHVEGRTDLVALEGVSFRRAADQFVFGQITDAVSAVREDALTSAYANDPPLARVDFDVTALRRAVPERYDAFFAEVREGVDGTDTAEQAGADLVIDLMRSVKRLGLSLTRADAGALRLGITLEPFNFAGEPPVKLTRPGMPPGTMFRADLAHPPAKALARVTDAINTLLEKDGDFARLPAPRQQQVRALATRAANLLLDGEAASLGVEAVEGHAVVYWIVQRTGGANDAGRLEKQMNELVQQADETAKAANQPSPLAPVATYDAGGSKVHRLVVAENGKPGLYIDAVQREGAVLMALSPADGKFVERLLTLEPEGETSARVSGWVNPSALAASGMVPGAQDAGLDAKAVDNLMAGLQNPRLAWTASFENGALRFDMDLPQPLLQNLVKAVLSLDQ